MYCVKASEIATIAANISASIITTQFIISINGSSIFISIIASNGMQASRVIPASRSTSGIILFL